MAYGVTSEGFSRKLLENILSELQEDQRSTISPNLNTSPASPHGQLNATFARQAAEQWEALESGYHAFDPDKAAGDALVSLCKLTGTVPSGATYSRVLCRVNLDNGTTLLSGVHFAEVSGNSASRFTPETDYTAVATGEVSRWFRAETTGPVLANATTLTVIATPLTGWNSVINDLDATAGHLADDDDTLRARREAELAKAGSTTALAIQADVLNIEVNGGKYISSVTVIENDTDLDGYNGLPRHTIETIVVDSPSVANDLIAQAIYNAKAAGIGTAGSEYGTALDPLGASKRVYFSRPLSRPIYLTYTITYGAGYVGDTQFKSNAVVSLTEQHGVGTDVFQWICELAGRQAGVKNLNVTLGFSASPTSEADLSIGQRELASFDTSRVVVVSTPAVT